MLRLRQERALRSSRQLRRHLEWRQLRKGRKQKLPSKFKRARGQRDKLGQQRPGMSPAGAISPGESFNQPGGKRNKRFEQPGMSPAGPQNPPVGPQGGPYGEGRGKYKAEGVNAPPTGG